MPTDINTSVNLDKTYIPLKGVQQIDIVPRQPMHKSPPDGGFIFRQFPVDKTPSLTSGNNSGIIGSLDPVPGMILSNPKFFNKQEGRDSLKTVQRRRRMLTFRRASLSLNSSPFLPITLESIPPCIRVP